MVTARSLRTRYLVLLGLRWLPVGFIAPLLALLPLSDGLSLPQVGVVFAVYGAVTAILELPTGGFADALGRRRILLVSSAVQLGFYALILVAGSFPLWIVAAAMGGIARALDSGPLEAWFVDETRGFDAGADLRSGLAGAGVVEAGALALSAVAGGILPQVFGGNLDVAVVAAIAGEVVHIVAVALLMTESRPIRVPDWKAATAGIPGILAAGARTASGSRPVRRLLIAAAAIGVALVAVEVLWQPRFTDLLGGRDRTGPLGFLLAGAFLASAVGASLTTTVARIIPARASTVVLATRAFQAGALLLLATATHVPVAGAAFVTVYFFLGLGSPLHQEILHEHVPPDTRTTMLSAGSLALQGGGLAGNLALPAVAAAAGIPWAWTVAAVVLGTSTILYAGIPDRPAVPVRAESPA